MDLTCDKQQCRGQCFHLIPAKVILLCNFKSIHSFFEQCDSVKPRDPNDPLLKHIAVKGKEVSISEKVEKFK